jgi:hypothetical protein
MRNKKIHQFYFNKGTNPKINLKKNKSRIPNAKTINLYEIKKKNDLISEDVNYAIDSISKNSFNKNFSYSTKNKLYKESINSKSNSQEHNMIIKKLENKIKSQKNQIIQLLEYKNLCEKRIKELNPEEILPLSDGSLDKTKSINIFNNSCSINNIKLGKEKFPVNDIIGFNKTLDTNINQNKIKDYNYKYTSVNSPTKPNYDNLDMIKLRNNYNQLKSDYNYLLKKYKKGKKKNLELSEKINVLEKNVGVFTQNDINEVNKYKEQTEILRKDLVLSQALVNSLKSENEELNKEKNAQQNKSLNKSRFSNSADYRNIKNIGYQGYDSINEENNYKTISEPFYKENEFLKQSLNNKNILLSNILEENNKLNNIIKLQRINSFENYNIKNENLINLKNKFNLNSYDDMKNNLMKYEDKLIYFNDYIRNVKDKII